MKSLYCESAVLLAAIVATLLTVFPQPSSGGSATWLANPGNGNWNNSANWTAGGPPNGSSDMAIFAMSNQTAISISTGAVEVDKIIFNASASPFTVSVGSFFNLRITGVGITNNSGTTQNFVATSNGSGQNGQVEFSNSASAGTSTVFTNNGGTVAMGIGGETVFLNTSTADHGTFNNNGAAVGATRSATLFLDNSTAGNGTFNNNAALFSNADGGETNFSDSATAGNGIFINKSATVSGAGAGGMLFFNSSTAGTGTFTNGGAAFSFTSGGGMQFFNTSTAANGTFINNGGTASDADGGNVIFFDTSNAGMAMFTNKAGTASGASGGFLDFIDTSTADAAVVVNNGSGLGGAKGGLTQFESTASAGNGTFTNDGGTANGAFGGITRFFDSSTAASATLIANGGSGGALPSSIRFYDDSTGGTSRIKVFIDGQLDISVHNVPGVTIGSIEGNGRVFLGANELIAGGNDLTTTFSGRMLDGGSGGGTGGSFTKIGTGILSFTNENAYTGGTTITSGTLEAKYDGALGGGDVAMLLAGATLTLQDGATNNYIADTATVNIVSSATVNLNFSGIDTVGVLIIDGIAQPPGLHGSAAANGATRAHSNTRISGFAGPGQILAELPVAVSRKLHGGTPYDIYLPVTGAPGIECRSDGTNVYQVVVRFLNNATFTSAQVTSGNGMVTSASGSGTTQAIINLSNVTNQQTIKITLFGLNDGLGMRDLVIPMAVLIGDTTGSGDVNSTDVSQTKDESGHLLTTANFREDVTVNGKINSTDVSTVKAHSGTGLTVAEVLRQNPPQRARNGRVQLR